MNDLSRQGYDESWADRRTADYYDLIIIGGGPAGLTAGLYAARAQMKTLIIEKMLPGGQVAVTDVIENYPGFISINGPDLAEVMEKQCRNFGVEFATLSEVSELRVENRIKFVVAPETVYKGKTLIVATGAKSKHIGVPGEEKLIGKGVSYCAVCDGAFFKEKEIAIVGGGDSAIKEGLFLSRYVKKINVVHRRDTLRAEKIHQQRAFDDPKFQFHWNMLVDEVVGDTHVKGLRCHSKLNGGESVVLPVEGVFVYVGMEPQTKFLQGVVSLDKDGYVMTDEKMQTNVSGIYAAGDVRVTPLRQVATAVGDGAIAAMMAEKYLDEH